MKRVRKNVVIYVVLAVLLVVAVGSLWSKGSSRDKITLSRFEQLVAGRQVKSAEIYDGSNEVKGELTSGTKFQTKYPAEYADELTTELKAAAVPKYEAKPKHDNVWLSLLLNYLPILVLFGAFLFLLNNMQGGGNRVMQFGKA